MHMTKLKICCVLSAFPLHFIQLFGIWICLGGLLLLLKYRYTGVFFSSCYIDLPVLLAVISGVLLLIGGSLGCVLSHIKSSCLQALVRKKRSRKITYLSAQSSTLQYMSHMFTFNTDGNSRAFFFQFVYFLIVVCCSVSTATALAYFHIGKVQIQGNVFLNVPTLLFLFY